MSGESGAQRLAEVFARLRTQGRKALSIYIMAGDPDIPFTERIVPEVAAAGADLIELGFPFSDPVADGPVIQAAGQRAIHQFSGLDDYLALVERIRQRTQVPLVCMTYYNPIFRYGEAKFLERCRAVSLDAVIIPDLPLDEGHEWREQCVAAGVAPVYLEAPNTLPDHATEIAKASQGFIYLVSLKGVTGAEKGLGENLEQRIQRLRAVTDTPLLVGFGISTPEQARRYGQVCDGVIVGSVVVKQIEQAGNETEARTAVIALVKHLRAGLDGA